MLSIFLLLTDYKISGDQKYDDSQSRKIKSAIADYSLYPITGCGASAMLPGDRQAKPGGVRRFASAQYGEQFIAAACRPVENPAEIRRIE